MFQCYYQSNYEDSKTRCTNVQEDYWCSEVHKNDWQTHHYKGVTMRKTKKLTVKQMQEKLLLMGKRVVL